MNRILKFKKQVNIVTVIKGLILLFVFLGIFLLCINSDHQQKIISNSNNIITSNAEDIWNSRWGGDSTDQGEGVAVDSNQSVYIIGTDYSHGPFGSYGLIKYFPNGIVAWNITWGNEHLQGGKGIVIFNDFIYCVGLSGTSLPPQYGRVEIGLIKVSPNGSVIWNTSYGRSSWTCYGWGVAADANGSLYCTGYGFMDGSSSFDLFLVKFHPNGTLLWNTSIPNAAGYNVAVDSSGFVYCVGAIWKLGTDINYGSGSLLLAKFSPEGTLIYNVSQGRLCSGSDIVIDSNDNIYCVGSSSDFGTKGDVILLKFFSNGTLIWRQTWGGLQPDSGTGVALDYENAIYCAGYTSSFGLSGMDFFIIKYLPTGSLIGYTIWDSGKDEICEDIAIDNADRSIYCGGYIITNTNPWNEDYLLVKFSLSIEFTGPSSGFFLFCLICVLIAILAVIYRLQKKELNI